MGHRKIKCEIIIVLVMLNLHVHVFCAFQLCEASYSAKKGGQTDEQQMNGRVRLLTTIGICWNFS